MTFADVPDVNRVTDDAFYDLDVTTRPADWPAPERRGAERAALWRRRIEHLITHDSPGCWVAEDDSGEVVGAVAALRRERLWGLSTYAVRPGIQATGIGKQLLDAALTYAEPDDSGSSARRTTRGPSAGTRSPASRCTRPHCSGARLSATRSLLSPAYAKEPLTTSR